MARRSFAGVLGILLIAISATQAQQRPAEPPVEAARPLVGELGESLRYVDEGLARRLDEAALFHRLEDLAEVDKGRFTGPPPRVIKNPTGQGAGNPVIIQAYTFLPRKFLSQGKLPLVILVHGGVHGDFNGNYVHVLRELLEQGYAILAPEYRGSSGYG